jgi:hypothetical protein
MEERRVVIKPGMVCYDEFFGEYFLMLERFIDTRDHPYWRTLVLTTGEINTTIEHTLFEDPDIKWVT